MDGQQVRPVGSDFDRVGDDTVSGRGRGLLGDDANGSLDDVNVLERWSPRRREAYDRPLTAGCRS